MKRPSTIPGFVLICTFGCVGILLIITSGISFMGDRIDDVMSMSQQRLVYHTDHQAVLDACREVLKNPQAAGFPPADSAGRTSVDGSQSGGPVSPALPKVLQNLQFEDMQIDKDVATIWFGSGFGHWGFITQSDGQNSWEMVPGLWYWEEEGGSLPRDTTKYPYYRVSKAICAASIICFVVAIGIAIRYLRAKRLSGEVKERVEQLTGH